MKNLTFSLALVDGSLLPLDFKNGNQLIHRIVGEEFSAPPRALVIEALADSGEEVRIVIPVRWTRPRPSRNH